MYHANSNQKKDGLIILISDKAGFRMRNIIKSEKKGAKSLKIKNTSKICMGLPSQLSWKESTFNAGDPGSIPGSGRFSGEGIGYPLQYSWASLVAELVKKLPVMWETWVRSLGWQDPLEKGTATHSSILAWRIPWTEEPGRLQSMGSPRVGHD